MNQPALGWRMPLARSLVAEAHPRPELYLLELCRRRLRWVGGITCREATSMMTTILIVILILALIGSLPTWGYSRGWGYGPGGGIGLLVIILIVLVLTGHI
jgi:hypothetical protein